MVWEPDCGLDCSPTLAGRPCVEQATRPPCSQPQSQRAPIQLFLPRSGSGFCSQGWGVQSLKSVDLSPQIPESLIYPPQPGQQHVIIQANWASTLTTSSMERIVPVAPHAGYIFIQTDKPLYTPEHLGRAPRHLASDRR